jgi:hypothetical protein
MDFPTFLPHLDPPTILDFGLFGGFDFRTPSERVTSMYMCIEISQEYVVLRFIKLFDPFASELICDCYLTNEQRKHD